jgi:N-methylhydantoinase B
MSIADRSILACWGVNGGKAGHPFQITVDPGGPDEHEVDALADAEPLTAGTVVRIRTTGGGGWGDPLQREPERVRLDVVRGVVSDRSAREDYGVVLDDGWDRPVDEEATRALRDELRTGRKEVRMFDRGGYLDRLRAEGGVRRPDGWADPDGVPA